MAETPVDPHEVDEDPEKCIGKLIKDPWADNSQKDWPNSDIEPKVSE